MTATTTRPAPSGVSAGSAKRWLAVAAATFAVAWGGNEFTPLLVMYREQSHFSQVTVNGLLAAYVLGIVPALLISGPLSDYIGRRPTMLPAAPLSLLGSFLLSIAPNEPLVIAVGRIMCGLALGIVMAVGSTWVAELITRAGGDPAADNHGYGRPVGGSGHGMQRGFHHAALAVRPAARAAVISATWRP